MSDASPTNRWRGVLVLVLGAAGVGLLAKRPLLLLVSMVGVVYAVYPAVSAVTRPDLELDRRVSEARPGAGTTVEVTTTVRNAGRWPILDLRLVDGVPPALAVTEGSPRLGTALRAGESARITYAVEAKRGRHRFEAATAVARDISGGHEIEVQVADNTALDCTTDLGRAPVADQTLDVSGRRTADSGGAGTEFHQTRSYRHGDPLGRIDWNRYARTGDLTTIEFREERAASVVVAVDATPSAYRGRPEDPHAVVAGVGAAQQIVEAVLADHNHVGLAALGRESVWLAPGSGREHRLQAQRLLATHPAFEARPPPEGTEAALDDQVDRLLARLSDNTQLLVVSPLLSDDVLTAIRRVHANRHAVTVVSPDVTVQRGAPDGRALAAIERRDRVRRLRQAGVTVVDWETATPLPTTVDQQLEGRAG